MPTVAVGGLLHVMDLMGRKDPRAVARAWSALGLSPSLAGQPDERVPARALLDLLALASNDLGDPHVGLRVAADGDLRRFALLGFLLFHSQDIREALGRSGRFHRLLNGALQVELREGDPPVVVFGIDAAVRDAPGVRHLLELATASMMGMLRAIVDRALDPVRVDFSVERPAEVAAVERVFRTKVRWGRPATEVAIPAWVLDARPRGGDPGLGRVLERYAEELVARLPPGPRSLSDRVRAALFEKPADRARIGAVARGLGLSVRSLQRGLLGESTTFGQLEDESRREVAIRYVRGSELGLSEIAFLLGFKDVSAFYRAFRRWTGATPGQLRKDGARGQDRGAPGQ